MNVECKDILMLLTASFHSLIVRVFTKLQLIPFNFNQGLQHFGLCIPCIRSAAVYVISSFGYKMASQTVMKLNGTENSNIIMYKCKKNLAVYNAC